MEELQLGDVVQLKSGGPLMTVTYVEKRPSLQCHWFKDEEVRFDSFNEAALKKAKTEGY